MTAQRTRIERLQRHVECALTQPSTLSAPFTEIARQLRAIVADDLTDDEILMAAHRVRAQWRAHRHDPYHAHYLNVVEANCARWRGNG